MHTYISYTHQLGHIRPILFQTMHSMWYTVRLPLSPYHTTLHYSDYSDTTLHYATLHYATLHYTTLHYTTLHYTTLHYTTLHYTILHYTTLYYTTLHYTTLHYTTLHYTTLHYTTHLNLSLTGCCKDRVTWYMCLWAATSSLEGENLFLAVTFGGGGEVRDA